MTVYLPIHMQEVKPRTYEIKYHVMSEVSERNNLSLEVYLAITRTDFKQKHPDPH